MSDEIKDDGGFIGRWSKRKTADRTGEPLELDEISEKSEIVAGEEQAEIADEDLPIPEDLPDIETLDKDSDFTLFMRKGTPEHLKRLALRKLFQSDPALAVLDGLNDYDEDYSMIGMVAEAVSTRYKPGKGIVDPDEEKELEEKSKDEGEEIVEEDQRDENSEEPDEETGEEAVSADVEIDEDELLDDDGDLESLYVDDITDS